jgi:hypothetical protein
MYKFVAGEYTGYLSRDVETDGSWIHYLIKQCLILILSVCNFKHYKEAKKYYTIFGLVVSGILLGMLEYVTNTQVGRIGAYFTCMGIVLMPYVSRYGIEINHKKVLSREVVTKIVYVYYFVLFLYSSVIRNFGDVFPYGNMVN